MKKLFKILLLTLIYSFVIPGLALAQNIPPETNQPLSILDGTLGTERAFQITAYYGKPLLYLYIYLLIAGYILSTNFRSKLKKFISGKIQNTDFKSTSFYGLHLIILFLYLYILLAFSIFLVWDLALIAILIVTNLNNIPIRLIIILFVTVVGSFTAIIDGLFSGRKRGALGMPIKRADQPKIWELCDNIAGEVGTKTVDEIYLSYQPGIGVHLSNGLFSLLFGRSKRTLTIGIGSISGLTVSQMEAMLAHEFGHFSNKDTAWNSLTFTMASTLQNTLSTMPKSSPIYWLLFGYRLLFSVVTMGFSRMREVFADKTAVTLYGYNNFATSLARVARNDRTFLNFWQPQAIGLLVQKGQLPTNIFDDMAEIHSSVDKSENAGDFDKLIPTKEKPSIFDSHPTLKERVDYAKHFEVIAEHTTNNAYFKNMFVNWGVISKNLSDLYSYHLAVLTGNEKLVSPNMCKDCGVEFRKGFLLENGLCAECDRQKKLSPSFEELKKEVQSYIEETEYIDVKCPSCKRHGKVRLPDGQLSAEAICRTCGNIYEVRKPN